MLDDGGGAGGRQMKRTHGDEIPEALRRKLAPRDRGRTKGWGHTHAPTNDAGQWWRGERVRFATGAESRHPLHPSGSAS